MINYNWVSIEGNFERKKDIITFKGGSTKDNQGNTFAKMGMYISNQKFGGGSIEAKVKFSDNVGVQNSCHFILSYDSRNRNFISAGISISPASECAYTIQTFNPFDKNIWNFYGVSGNKNEIKPNIEYRIKTILTGSFIELFINDVNVLSQNLNFLIPYKQSGIWCHSYNDIFIKDYVIKNENPKVFVIMEYSKPFDDLYTDVIKPILNQNNIEVTRADETYKSGLIIYDIFRQIYESKFIIAEITPVNQNVYFEIGYAYAMNKPIIFIAEKGKELPFDISGFRVLFYENSIGGKKKIEEGLNKHINSILSEWSGYSR